METDERLGQLSRGLGMRETVQELLRVLALLAVWVSLTETILILHFYRFQHDRLSPFVYASLFVGIYILVALALALLAGFFEILLPHRLRWIGSTAFITLAAFLYGGSHWRSVFGDHLTTSKALVGFGLVALFSLLAAGIVLWLRQVSWRRSIQGFLAALVVGIGALMLEGALDVRTDRFSGSIGSSDVPREHAMTTAPSSVPRPKAIVIVSFDALRADHLGSYGYARAVSPELDRIFERALVFDGAIAPKANTSPSLASLITGIYPPRHGLERIGWVLGDDAVTLAALLDGSYRTAAFISNPVFHVPVSSAGFDVVRLYDRTKADIVLSDALEWVKAQDPSDPFLLWVHLFEPHAPYEGTPEDFEILKNDGFSEGGYSVEAASHALGMPGKSDRQVRAEVEKRVTQYDSAIRFATRKAAHLVETIERSRSRTLFVITADHGESMTEHDFFFWHGTYAYQPVVHVPLAFYFPSANRVDRVTGNVSLVDILPTICGMVGCKDPPDFDGIDLMRARVSGKRAVFTSARDNPRYASWTVLKNGWKLTLDPDRRFVALDGVVAMRASILAILGVRPASGNPFRNRVFRYELYRLLTDPSESDNLARKETLITEQMAQELLGWLDLQYASGTTQQGIDPQTQRRLRSLGYIE